MFGTDLCLLPPVFATNSADLFFLNLFDLLSLALFIFLRQLISKFLCGEGVCYRTDTARIYTLILPLVGNILAQEGVNYLNS